MNAMIGWTRTPLALLVALLVATAALEAIGPTRLPATGLTTLSGESVRLDAVPLQSSWLIVYVRTDCAPCQSMLHAVETEAGIAKRTIVIVGGAAHDAVGRIAADYPLLQRAAWFADAKDAFAKELGIQEAPVILGVADRTIQWSLAGVISGRNRTQNLMRSWIAMPLHH